MPNSVRSVASIFLILFSCLIGAGGASAQERGFSHPLLASEAKRYEEEVKKAVQSGQASRDNAQALVKAASKARTDGDARKAVSILTRAASQFGGDGDIWRALSQALAAVETDQSSEQSELTRKAAAAAYIAVERTTAKPQRAESLALLAEALKKRSMWRPALDAYRASLSNAEVASVRTSFDDLLAEHGFKVADYKVEANLGEPRLCLQMSERIAPGRNDIASFVRVDGRDPQGVQVEGSQLCIEGLKHGKRYEVQVRAGLPSDGGETLIKTADIAVYVRDRNPSARFTGRSYVLPNKGQQGIPVVTVNTDKITIEVYRIGDRALAATLQGGDFGKQVSEYELEQIKSRTGELVWKGELDVKTRLNEDVTTAVPVSEAVPSLKPGAYVMSAKPVAARRSDDGAVATQWFIVSDLGLTSLSGDDGIHAFVRSLSTAEPVSGVNVRVVARNNEVLGEGKSDAQGYVHFAGGIRRGEGGLAPQVLVADTAAGDYAFMDLTAAAFDLTDRGVKGREPPKPIDGYLFPERGVYRPGETVHLTALVRDREAKAALLPATLILYRANGVEHQRFALVDQGIGGRSVSVPLASTVGTGTWRAKLFTDPKADPVAETRFLVEDYVPERLDLTLTPVTPTITPGVPATINATGRYLYGPPAARLALEGDVVVKPASGELPGFAGYQFGRADERVSPVRKAIEGLPETGSDGTASLSVVLPAIPRTARPLEADLLIRLREASGRTIERKLTLPVGVSEPRVGLKSLFKGEDLGETDPVSFDAVLVGTDGQQMAAKAFRWELIRLDTNWQWYSRDGNWNYEAVTTRRRVTSGRAEPLVGTPARIEARAGWGRYRMEVSSEDAPNAVSSVDFSIGWYGGEAAESPEMLEVGLDKASYKPGETAKVRIVSKQAGKAMLSILGSGLNATRQVEIGVGDTEIAVPVDSGWTPGAYVAVTLYRPLDEKARRMPGRAVGLRWLPVDVAARTLKVELTPPQVIKSGTTLTVPVKVDGLAAGEDARITVAAVDLGILNLTRYQRPTPEAWFYGQRRLGLEMRDLYGRLIDGMRAERGRLRSGGDGDESGSGMRASPSTDKPLALYSGIVKVGPDGRASVSFDIPEFNGTARLMAAAWSADKVGSGTSDVIIRDAVAVTATSPRFLALGDEGRLDLDVHNVEGPAGQYTVTVDQQAASGAKSALASKQIELRPGARHVERVALKPTDLGRVAYGIVITGPGGIEVKRSVTLLVKPPAGDIRRITMSTLTPKGKLSISPDLLHDLIPATASMTVNVGPAASFNLPGLLMSLDRYPYGCAEQTTSRAMPLLYVNEMARRIGIADDAQIKERIQAAIGRVLEMQDAAGAFGVWGPSSADLWLTSYVTDFLTRAKELGYTVPPLAMTQALDRLQNFVVNASDFQKGGETRAYALYVLARNGRAPVGELRYYADTRLDRFDTALAQAQLGAALAMIGDKERAERAFRAAMSKLDDATVKSDLRIDYGSQLRDGAAIVTLAAETRTLTSEVPRLATVVAKAMAARQYTSTQEQSWLLLAARALETSVGTTTLSVGGTPQTGPLTRAFKPSDIGTAGLTISNEGDIPVGAVVTAFGASLTAEPATERGFKIERSYYSLEGKKIDLASASGGAASLKQNDRLVVVLKIDASETGGRILLVDRLPAGLEIENARLVDSGDIKSLDWLKRTVEPEHTEFRDDRFVAAFDLFAADDSRPGKSGSAGSSATVAYIVRAVTPGSFAHPAATVEDMYRPERFARTAAGRLTVTQR